MLKEFKKGESRSLSIDPEGSQEAEALSQGVITGRGITGGEAAAELEVIEIVIMVGTGSIVTEAEAGLQVVVKVLVIVGDGVEANIMMRGVGLMKVLLLCDGVLVLRRVQLHTEVHHTGVEVLMLIITKKDQPLLGVSLLVMLILGVLHILMLRSNDLDLVNLFSVAYQALGVLDSLYVRPFSGCFSYISMRYY